MMKLNPKKLLLLALVAVFAVTTSFGAVVTYTIGGSTDDAASVTNATGELSSVIYWPYTNPTRMSFLRWQSTIPRGATITEAYVKVRSNGTAGNSSPSVIRLEVLDTANTPMFSASDNPFFDTVMTNYVDSTVPGTWAGGEWNTSADVKSLVQAYIDRPDYAYGNYIGLRGSWVSGSYKGAHTWNYGDHSGAPQLEVHYTGGEVMLELWMADPETRLGQKVYCQIINRSSTDTLRVKLDGTIIHTKAAPLSETEEIFTVDYRTLGAGSHTLLVDVLDAGGAVVASDNRTWTKLHEGIAKVAINENNAICRNGVPFFPITPWGVGASSFPTWEGQINALTGQPFSLAKNLTGWETFLQSIEAYDYPVMGPAFGDYWPGGYTDNDVDIDGVRVYFKELDLNRVTEYINASKNDPSMLMYVWHDEPDLGGPTQYIPATEVHRWTEKTHELDTQHPHYLNLVGYPFTQADPYPNYNNLEAQSYCFLFNDQWSAPMGTNQPFAKKTLVADVLAFDYYPYDLAPRTAYTNWIGLADLTLAIDRLREWNYNLAPTMTWIETCDIVTNAPNHVAPTPVELNNLIWLSIIHQVKGIQWFHYFEETPPENRVVMETATEWITSLTQPILSAPENVTWTVGNQGVDAGRVDFMTRQYEDRLYIFSTSIPTNGILTSEMAATANVRFDMPGLTNGAQVGVLGENRIITASPGYFEDTFSPLAVHIYTYPALTNLPPAAKAGRDRLISDTDRNGLETVTLTDAGSLDPDGTITSYVWMDGAVQIATGATAQVSLSNGTHVITLVVTDNGGDTGSSTISVVVNPPPIAHAGSDQQVTDADNNGFELITLDGSTSTDDSPLASYAWIEGGNVVATGMTAQVSVFAGTHDITLEVTDSNGQTDSDIVQIIVLNPNVVTAQYQIAASVDDAYSFTNASGYLGSKMYFPYSSTNRLAFLRWPLNIPDGSVILSADVQVKSAGTKGDQNPSTIGLQLIDSDSSPSFLATPYYLPVTATTEEWVLEGAWVTNQWYRSGNIKTLVQEFIDRAGYVSGNYMGLRCGHLAGNWKEAYQWDNSGHADGAILEVTYLPVWALNYTLTYTAGAHGTISGTATQTVASGASGTAVTAVPDSGYQFINWSDASTDNPRTDASVNANISVTANFATGVATASFSASTTSGTAPLAITFTDTSTGTITNRIWDFGDGGTTNTTETSVAHTYTAAGTNTVQLIVVGPAGSSTNTQVNLITASAPLPAGTLVHLDLSASYNYDAYATGEEIANSIDVDGTLGDHSLLKSVSGWTHLVDPGGATYLGIPSTTINGGEFELAAGLTGDKFGTATGTTKVNNTVARLSTDGSLATVRTATVMLEAAQQGNYSDFNVLMTANRYGTRTVTMTALIEVKYVGDANWYTAWTESQVPSAGEPGGCFGGGFNSPTGTDSHQSTAWTEVLVNGDVANGYYKNTTPASGADYMYKLVVAPTLDPLKTLEGFRFTASTTDQNRYNDFALYAISATSVGTAPGGTDDDSDGLPNDWETQYFGGPTNANPSALAANGINTIMEAYIGGLDPTNALSVFALSGQVDPSQTILQWNSVTGRIYSVFWATNLLSGFQSVETNLPYPQNSWTDQVHGAENEGFYQLKVQLNP